MLTQASTAVDIAALGNDTRLGIFRVWVRAGHDGMSVGDIGQHLSMAPSTLAHHLGTLVEAGLVTQERQGRLILNRVDYDVMNQTLAFLTAECCVGVKLTQEYAA